LRDGSDIDITRAANSGSRRGDAYGEPSKDVRVRLPEREQPAAVITLYGPNGERMTGEDVVEGGDSFHAAVASTTTVKP
jgi:hypothetical protein